MRGNETLEFGEDAYVHDDGCVYSADRTVLLACTTDAESYRVLETCTEVAPRVFKSKRNLKRVALPDGMTAIGDFAFAFSGIEEFVCPASLRHVGMKAFYCCKSLACFSADDALESIGDAAFEQTALEQLDLPASVRELGAGILRASKLALEFESGALSMDPQNPRFLIDAFGALYAREPEGLVLQELMVDAIREHEVLAGAVRVASNAYRYNSHIERVILPEGVRQVGNAAFCRCSSLVEVRLPETLESLGADAFYAAPIREVYLPERLSRIGMCALMAMSGPHELDSTLERVTVHPGNRRFYTTGNLLIERRGDGERLICHFGVSDEIHVPRSVTEIGPYAFLGCGNARLLELHDTIRRIHCSAFVLDRAIEHVRVLLSEPVCGRDYVDVYFPHEVEKFILFPRAFYKPLHDWQELTETGVQFVGLYSLSPSGKEGTPDEGDPAQVPSGYAFSAPGMPVPSEDRESASSYAFDQFEGELDVPQICENGDHLIRTLHHDMYLYARLATRRLEVPQYLSEANEATFRQMLRRKTTEAVVGCARHGDVATLGVLVDQGIIDEDNIDACIDAVNGVSDITAASYLLQVKHERMGLARFDFGI